MERKKPLTGKIIWLFAIGQLGWSLLSALITNWVTTFYQPDAEMMEAGQKVFFAQDKVVFGLLTILGGVFAFGRLWDAITDPLIANFSDKSKNPKGRRIPFMAKAAIPFSIAAVLVYWCPVNGNSPVNAWWVFVMLILFYLFMTMYCTPYNSLIAELSGNQKELTDISTAISFTFIFGSAIGYAAPYIWGPLTGVFNDRVMAIRVTFTILAAIGLICLLVPVFTIKEKDYVVVKDEDIDSKSNVIQSLAKTFKNKDFVTFVTSDVCYWIAITMFQTGLPFFVTSLMKLEESWNTTLYIGMTLLSVLCYLPVNMVVRKGKLQKKHLIMFAFIQFSIVYLITSFASGTAGTNDGLVFGLIVVALAAVPMAILGILPQTIVADVAKEDEILTGENRDGMFFAARTFSMKLGQAIATVLFTSLATIGASYDEEGNLLTATGQGYRVAAVVCAICCFGAAIILNFYNEKKIMATLKEHELH
ncbi:MAG: MFS transporter [Pseudobutyrivibrio sp.]|nr:MFS transporter [Pseudobutyrivibrio sp.]